MGVSGGEGHEKGGGPNNNPVNIMNSQNINITSLAIFYTIDHRSYIYRVGDRSWR